MIGDINNPAHERRTLPDGRLLDLLEELFTWKLGVTLPEDDGVCYCDVYQYVTFEAAFAAFRAWDGTGEPEGWNRHYGTGRRRPDGTAASEYVAE